MTGDDGVRLGDAIGGGGGGGGGGGFSFAGGGVAARRLLLGGGGDGGDASLGVPKRRLARGESALPRGAAGVLERGGGVAGGKGGRHRPSVRAEGREARFGVASGVWIVARAPWRGWVARGGVAGVGREGKMPEGEFGGWRGVVARRARRARRARPERTRGFRAGANPARLDVADRRRRALEELAERRAVAVVNHGRDLARSASRGKRGGRGEREAGAGMREGDADAESRAHLSGRAERRVTSRRGRSRHAPLLVGAVEEVPPRLSPGRTHGPRSSSRRARVERVSRVDGARGGVAPFADPPSAPLSGRSSRQRRFSRASSQSRLLFKGNSSVERVKLFDPFD